jgi:S-adenosylmethionine:tRNA ribosyltransferase-isomerase
MSIELQKKIKLPPLSDFDYPLDPALIAAEPLADRDQSRLLVYDRKTQTIEHRRFDALTEYLEQPDLLVANNTRVFPARLRGLSHTGKEVELLLLKPLPENPEARLSGYIRWEILAKGKHKAPVTLHFPDQVQGTIVQNLEGGRRELQLELPAERYHDIYHFLETWGEIPLPPYILKRRGLAQQKTRDIDTKDRDRYQTLYAKHWGSAAAPTAGLHFSRQLLERIKTKGIQVTESTLHIGLDTFQPIRSESLSEHKMHREWFEVSKKTAALINETRRNEGRVVAIGTTVTRALESAALKSGEISAISGSTNLFITPGYTFKGIDALITNFHLPKSTLLVMISAFAGADAVKKIYEEAINQRYRFYSYGDAMLII